MGPHSSNIQKNCAARDKSIKFGTHVERYIIKQVGYLATADLAADEHGSLLKNGGEVTLKWLPEDLKWLWLLHLWSDFIVYGIYGCASLRTINICD